MTHEREYVVKPGDCISRIAYQHGLSWRKLWDFNKALKEKRGNPNILFAGDVVRLPPVEDKKVQIATGNKHTFQVRGGPPSTSPLRLRLKENGRPRGGLKCVLHVEGGDTQELTTDAEGMLLAQVPTWARKARLTLATPKGPELYSLLLGHLDPLNEIRGVQQRLSNLGISCPLNGRLDEATRQAVTVFQNRTEGLNVTGDPFEPATLEALRLAHGA